MKVVLVGDSSVGKTAIFQRVESGTFDDKNIPTIGGAYNLINVETPSGRSVEVGLWDTAGQERFRTLVPTYFQRADIIIFVYDVTNRDSFTNIKIWLDIAMEKAPETVKFLLIGNKSDLIEQRLVSYGELQDKGAEIGAAFSFETSALNGDGLDIFMSAIGKVAEAKIGMAIEDEAPTVRVTAPPAKIAHQSKKDQCQC